MVRQQVPNIANLSDEKRLRHELEFFLDCEEALWAQKSRYLLGKNTQSVDMIFGKLQKYDIPSLQQNHVDILNKPFTFEECHVALNQMKPDGAPGLDGFNVRFYRTYWETLKNDVLSMVKSFFDDGFLLNHMNKSYLMLIPKTTAPDFRPISLANVSYKLVTKVLCNRLKCCLPDLIAPNQSAF
ncbi:Transposon TX1 uncharacterized 149 kDa protein [Senna tora]|uniref:Transposon TX1 uncharacterized 149 kDa protein n=1 Tax=Senna tora TaxID=362788 RepID=A0A835CE84_9FABA|nr:Transposon TX1 uncharacterized 149 kDa protein [Senna tora]